MNIMPHVERAGIVVLGSSMNFLLIDVHPDDEGGGQYAVERPPTRPSSISTTTLGGPGVFRGLLYPLSDSLTGSITIRFLRW